MSLSFLLLTHARIHFGYVDGACAQGMSIQYECPKLGAPISLCPQDVYENSGIEQENHPRFFLEGLPVRFVPTWRSSERSARTHRSVPAASSG